MAALLSVATTGIWLISQAGWSVDAAGSSGGPVSTYDVPIEIRGKRVEYRGQEGRAVFSGGVTVKRGAATLKADELETIRGSSEAIARGNVVFQDREKNLDLTCEELVYTHGLKKINAKGGCQLIVGEGEDVTVVTSDEMEMMVDEREAIARGSVRIIQGENEATCGEAHLFSATNSVILTGRPVLRRPPHEFECDRAVTYFKEGRTMLSGRVKGRLHTGRLQDLRGEAATP